MGRFAALRTPVLATSLLVAGSSVLLAQARMVDTTPAAGTIAITGGKLLTITRGVIENGVVLIEGGKIAAVGTAASVKVPKGATVVDAKGMTVYPGLFDAETRLGLSEIGSDRTTNDTIETSEEIFPQMHVYDAFHAESEHIPITRYNGITNAIVAPAESDTIPGQDSLIQLAGRDRDSMLMVKDVALAMNFGEAPKRGARGEAAGPAGGRYPSTRMGEISQMRQALLDAQEYMARRADTSKKPAGEEGAAVPAGGRGGAGGSNFNLRNEALIPYLKGEKPVVLGAYDGHDVETAMAFAQEFHLKVVLSHLTRANDILDKVASYHVPVIVGPIYDLPGPNERYDAVYSVPGELAKRGVKVILASYNVSNSRNLPYSAGFAVAYGLPYDEAMKSITLNPAEVFGVADKLGSLDVGKIANVVIADGDPLDVRTSVKQVYINGVAIPMETRQTKLRDEYWPKK
ncbi:MAG TPA: amidohydrolase family protein [Edaphobacter sp.]|nr:amidohydrolase family protein [Edaphobacter sp.]